MVLREGAQGELDVVIGDPVGAETAIRAVPGRDSVEGCEDEGRRDRGIRGAEGPDGLAIGDLFADLSFRAVQVVKTTP